MTSPRGTVRQVRLAALVLIALAFVVFLLGGLLGPHRGPRVEEAIGPSPWQWETFSGAALEKREDAFAWAWPGVGRVSLDETWQTHAVDTMKRYDPPYAAVLLQNLSTGQMLAVAGTSGVEAFAGEPFQHPLLGQRYVAASIMKLPTAAVLLETGEAKTATMAPCTGAFKLPDGTVANHGNADHGQLTLADALAVSCNTVFARYAQRIGWPKLEEMVERVGWTQRAMGVPATQLPQVEGDLEGIALSEAASGFGHVLVTPWHMLSLASLLGAGGQALPPRWIERDWNAVPVVQVEACGSPCVVMPGQWWHPTVANELLVALKGTVHHRNGTAWRGFYTPAGVYRLPQDVTVYAKTGSLNNPDPQGYLTWFVGVVKREGQAPLGMVTMVLNQPEWKIRAASLAGEILATYPGW